MFLHARVSSRSVGLSSLNPKPLLLALLALLVCTSAGRAARAATFTLGQGANLQQALDSAQPGDTIVLAAGASFVGPFTLPNKQGDGWITVQSSTLSQLPEGRRVTPADSARMPKILAPNPGRATFAVETAPGAHHFRFLGVEFTLESADAVTFELITLGQDGRAQTEMSQVPHHFLFDRCYIHGLPGVPLKRGLSFNSAFTDITNSHVAECHVRGQDSQAIAGWNGPGPFRIVNNFLEGSGENVMFGGAEPGIPGLVVSDVEVRLNHFSKQPGWRDVWSVKNLLEFKNGRRVVVDGNLFEYNWLDAQQGYAILFTPRPNDSGPAAVVEDVRFTNNVVRHVAAAVFIQGQDSLSSTPNTVVARRITVSNNLFYDVDASAWGGDGAFLKVGAGAESVTVDHNTVDQKGNITKVWGLAMTNFVFTNNLMSHNEYGVMGDEQSPGLGTLTTYFPGYSFARNVVAGDNAYVVNHDRWYPANNFFPTRLDDAGFVDRAGGNYRLQSGSPYVRSATDGKDVGCDFAALDAAMGGAPATPTPTPTPSATPTPAPSATPTPAATPAPTPTPVPTPTGKAQGSLHKARKDAQIVSNDLAATTTNATSPFASAATMSPADRIAAVVADVQQTYIDFSNERTLFPASSRIETALSSALVFAASASSSAGQGQLAEAKTSLQKAIDNLELADVLMSFGDVQNPLDFAQYFVRQHYVDFLGREPDEAGRAFWQSQIDQCGADTRCVEVKRINVSAAYFLSIEFRETGFLAYKLYRASLGRTPLMREFFGDTQEISKGIIVGELGWQERLAANKSVFFKAWVQRADFRGRYDSMTNSQFVDSLYASMGVAVPQSERDSLVSSLQTGAATRADVLAKLIDNADFTRFEKNRAFVLMQYFGYMRRDPDQIGWDFWLKKLDDNNGDFVKAQMVKAFLSSDEYRNRFRQQ
ncbi:MAG TPA: DUF4214 domain-containing protein [Pyrinomonadaceae bacterium]|jgi:hypothetical protein|nr:DUF4214 domain-containing protein [Pyrinomonadaceae bacterium]